MLSVQTETLFQSKPARPGQCPGCRAAFMRRVTVSSVFWRDQSAMIVRCIPAYICDGCGEDFVSDATVTKLDRIKAVLLDTPDAKAFVQVPVLDYGRVYLPDC
jgi:YgiT-type zinc finger domain-containing protein